MQLHTVREWSATRGWLVVAEEVDRVSGDPARRKREPPGLGRALRLLGERKADILVVFSADRLLRSTVGLLQLVARVQSYGAHVASYQDGADLDTTTDLGELMVFVRGWLARMELKFIRMRTRDGMAAAKAKGVHVGRPRVVLPAVDEIERLRADGLSLPSVARRLGCSEWAVRQAKATRAQERAALRR